VRRPLGEVFYSATASGRNILQYDGLWATSWGVEGRRAQSLRPCQSIPIDHNGSELHLEIVYSATACGRRPVLKKPLYGEFDVENILGH
jgi:hypothetical protein